MRPCPHRLGNWNIYVGRSFGFEVVGTVLVVSKPILGKLELRVIRERVF